MMFHTYPIRLYAYADGVAIQRIGDQAAAGMVGAEVTRIGNLSIDQALEAVSRVVHHDNPMQAKLLAAQYLVIPEVLHALGMVDDMNAAAFTVRPAHPAGPAGPAAPAAGAGGPAAPGEQTLILAPTPLGQELDWVDARQTDPPLSAERPDDNYWFTALPEQNAVYCQYNEVINKPDESIAAFAERLTLAVAQRHARALVLDLRYNPGGDNAFNRAFLHALIRCPDIQEPGSLFVLIGRRTFSAALMFALDLEKHTNAVFVGEPTGGRPNHYGDSRKLELPHSGLTIRASTLYWQYGGPQDDRPWIPPHIPVAPKAEDCRRGRDPVLETALQLSRPVTRPVSQPVTQPVPQPESEPESEPAAQPVAGTAGGQVKDPVADPVGEWMGRVAEYDIVVHLTRTADAWQGTLDLPTLGAADLPLAKISYNAPAIHFEFPNGDDTIVFDGTLRACELTRPAASDDAASLRPAPTGDQVAAIIGKATLKGQSLVWVVHR